MIITENEGLNLNSPIVQATIANWPAEKLARTKFYYGKPPTVETVGESSYHEWKDEDSMQFASGYSGPNESPLEAIRRINSQSPPMPSPLPSYQFNGALGGGVSQPSYFDFNQPTGYIPTSAPVRYGHQPVQPVQQAIYQNKYAPGYYQQNGYPQHSYNPYMNAPNMNQMGQPTPQYVGYNNTPGAWVPIDAGQPIQIIEPQAPYDVIKNGPGTVYMNCEPYMYNLAVQPDPHIPVPSREYLEGIQNGQNFMNGYSNPFMPGYSGSQTVQSRIDQANKMALHNYAIFWGFDSVKEMEANDLSIKKALSIASLKYIGASQEYIDKVIEEKYDKPFREKYGEKKPITYEQIQQETRAAQMERKRTEVILHVKLKKGNKVIAEVRNSNHVVGADERFSNRMYVLGKQAAEQDRINRIARLEYHHNNALERKYDSYGLVRFCNEAIYDLHLRDLKRLALVEKAKKKRAVYVQGDFKRDLIARFGRQGHKNKLMEEDYRFRRDEELPEGRLRGSFGLGPLGMQLNPETDPRQGYCFEYDLNSNDFMPKMPRSDEELMKIKNHFLVENGQEVPLHARADTR